MDYFPLFYQIKNRPCLVVGGGEVASRKVALLLKANADVTVVSPELGATLEQWKSEGTIKHIAGKFSPEQIEGQVLIIACTDDEATNKLVHETAVKNNIPVNVVDNPKLCTFIVPSILDRSPLVAAISTGGASPVLARLLRARLETVIPAGYGKLAALAGSFRDKVKQRFSNPADRRIFWENMLQSPIAEMVFSGKDKEAKEAIEKALVDADEVTTGEVYLVGAGPGDPDLLTFRALRLMQQADVIVNDRLVSKEIMELCRRDAEIIYVGKERDKHAVPQEDINQILVRLAKEGKRVCRLKGGDPFIFGRGGEEIETLAAEQVPFQVVPAITAASGAASYAGIPLTHRDYSQSVTFVTGNRKDGTVDLNWKALAHKNQTIVFYMGLMGIEIICKQMIAHGLPETTPVALVQKATTPEQKVFIADLASMPDLVKSSDIQPPTLIIVGEVVNLHKKLSWFHS
ncbi:MAG: siroheme synthase CysG [Gammaproteobacteria bacterium]|nr:siroheme synthase CysG [Gammaproteobacteria bacterium]